jgi:hypothetical protein
MNVHENAVTQNGILLIQLQLKKPFLCSQNDLCVKMIEDKMPFLT